jgi:ADP-ribose pyrophosphatase YjhB (NUDIX family)
VPKRDYYDDPSAPSANSIVVAVSVFVQDDASRVLLIRRTDNDEYAIPGGAVDIGETVAQAAIRETAEETGIDIEITGLVGIYSDPGHVIAYDGGEVRQEFSLCFRAKPIAGEPRTSNESKEVHWVRPTEISTLNVGRANRLRIEHGLQQRQDPYIG